ncbi:homocysteine S-methyltransferase family protein [candidate division KSB1 bacterium]
MKSGLFLDRLSKKEIIISDGAFGTMLMERGLQPGTSPELFGFTHPEILKDITQRYLDAGAEIIHSNTFGASPVKLADYGLENKTEEINSAAVSVVRQVVRDRGFIAASCGPSGKILKPYGDADPEILFAGFTRQIESLIDSGVDIITIETMTDLKEAEIAIRAAKSVSPLTPVVATMTFEKIPRGFYTIMGVEIKEAAESLIEAGADVIGSNCGNGIEIMIEIAREFTRNTSVPVIIQSNAGMPRLQSGILTYPETPEFFGEKTYDLISAGVSVIGGCCGTTPDHISAIKKAVVSHRGRTDSQQ